MVTDHAAHAADTAAADRAAADEQGTALSRGPHAAETRRL